MGGGGALAYVDKSEKHISKSNTSSFHVGEFDRLELRSGDILKIEPSLLTYFHLSFDMPFDLIYVMVRYPMFQLPFRKRLLIKKKSSDAVLTTCNFD